MKINLERLLRSNIKNLKPYTSARDEFSGSVGIFLDANENPLGSVIQETAYRRYPDPLQREIKKKLAVIEGVSENEIFLGNGSDEAIDLLLRAFCNPGKEDNVVILPPTYGMYQVSAAINDVAIREVKLTPEFQMDVEKVLHTADSHTKIIFVCSPNNPTGNLLKQTDILSLLERFEGIVVVDEAYIDFCPNQTLLKKLSQFNHLVILKTFSKAWGMAGLRLGMAFASKEIIEILNRIKPPYNVNEATQQLALQALDNHAQKIAFVQQILEERSWLEKELPALACVEKVYPSDANFLLIKVSHAQKIYDYLIERQIIVRNRSSVVLCENCLRITVGNHRENQHLLQALGEYV